MHAHAQRRRVLGDDQRLGGGLREPSDQADATHTEVAIRAAADDLGVTVPLVRVIAGWGDVFFVTVQVHAAPGQDRQEVERVLTAATGSALKSRRHTLSLSWIR
jgi:hypothetical protein